MKNRKSIKITNLILASLMALVLLTSCAAPSQAPSAAPTTAQSAAPAASASAAEASATPAAPANTTEFSLFINMTWFWTDQWVGIIPDAITQKTGVKFNVTRAADDKQLGLLIASDDLPDVVFTDSNINRLSDAKYCYDYGDLMSKYTPDWQANPMQVMIAKTKSTDGKYYYLPNEVATVDDWHNAKAGAPNFASLCLRQDILKALGNPALNNMDDLMNIFGQVKAKYPDMVVVELDKDWGSTFFENQLGVPMYYPTGLPVFKTQDGKLNYITEHPKYKTYLQYMNKMYQKGYITAENYAIKNASESQAFVSSNKCFGYTWCGNNSVTLNALGQKTDPNISWGAVNPTLGGSDVHLITSGTGWCGTFITRKNQHPDIAIKFLQFMYSPDGQRLSEWGREGTEWTMGDDGLPKFIDDWKAASKDDNVMYKKYTPAFIFGISPTIEAAGRALNDTDDIRAFNEKVRAAVEIQPELNLSLPGADTDANTTLTKLENMRQNEEVKCILSKSDAEFETNFTNLINQTKSLGVTSLDEVLNTNMQNLPK